MGSARGTGVSDPVPHPVPRTRREAVARALSRLAPRIPDFEAEAVLDRAASSPGLRKAAPETAAWLGLVAYARHVFTEYDALLDEGYDRDSARHFVLDDLNAVLAAWGARRRVSDEADEDDVPESPPAAPIRIDPRGAPYQRSADRPSGASGRARRATVEKQDHGADREADDMKISARNTLKGRVVSVEKGATTAHVKIEIASGQVVTAAITNEAVDALALSVGSEAYAVIKSSDVMVATD